MIIELKFVGKTFSSTVLMSNEKAFMTMASFCHGFEDLVLLSSLNDCKRSHSSLNRIFACMFFLLFCFLNIHIITGCHHMLLI